MGSVIDVAEWVLQHQLDEVRALLHRARSLFGAEPVEPPTQILPEPEAAESWVQ